MSSPQHSTATINIHPADAAACAFCARQQGVMGVAVEQVRYSFVAQMLSSSTKMQDLRPGPYKACACDLGACEMLSLRHAASR